MGLKYPLLVINKGDEFGTLSSVTVIFKSAELRPIFNTPFTSNDELTSPYISEIFSIGMQNNRKTNADISCIDQCYRALYILGGPRGGIWGSCIPSLQE